VSGVVVVTFRVCSFVSESWPRTNSTRNAYLICIVFDHLEPFLPQSWTNERSLSPLLMPLNLVLCNFVSVVIIKFSLRSRCNRKEAHGYILLLFLCVPGEPWHVIYNMIAYSGRWKETRKYQNILFPYMNQMNNDVPTPNRYWYSIIWYRFNNSNTYIQNEQWWLSCGAIDLGS
jgi:hypothetical protein